jgi:hypothetical protein
MSRSFVSMYVPKKDRLGKLPKRKAVEVKIFDEAPKLAFNIVGWERMGWGVHHHGDGKFSLTKPDGTLIANPTVMDVEAMHQCYRGKARYRIAGVVDSQ